MCVCEYDLFNGYWPRIGFMIFSDERLTTFGYIFKCKKLRFFYFKQGGRGHWTVYSTSSQSFIITFYNSLAQQLWGLSINFDLLFN